MAKRMICCNKYADNEGCDCKRKALNTKTLNTTTIKIKTADTTFIKLGKGKYKYKHSNEIAPGVFVDMSSKGEMIVIEIIRKHSLSITKYER